MIFIDIGSLAETIKQEIEDNTYNEITIRRYDGVVHITLTPVSTIMKNALNISVNIFIDNNFNVNCYLFIMFNIFFR